MKRRLATPEQEFEQIGLSLMGISNLCRMAITCPATPGGKRKQTFLIKKASHRLTVLHHSILGGFGRKRP